MSEPSSSWKRRAWFGALGLLGLLSLAWLPVNRTYLRAQEQALAWKKIARIWQAQLAPLREQALDLAWNWPTTFAKLASDSPPPRLLQVAIWLQRRDVQVRCIPSPCGARLLWELKRSGGWHATDDKAAAWQLTLQSTSHTNHFFGVRIRHHLTLHATLRHQHQRAPWRRGVASQRAFHWLGLLPPLAAIFFALLTRRILLSLFLSLLLGAVLQEQALLAGLQSAAQTYIWKKAIFKEFSFNIILFTLSLIGMINVCTRNGGVRGLIERLLGFASTARSSRILTALLGVLIFFDDYANTIMVGNTMRPLTDRFRVSREKLAYLVDSTAAPIAGIALLSTWIGYEVGLLGDITSQMSLPTGGYQLFLSSLPFRFYCWMTLLFVTLNVLLNRDYGPMYEAEQRAQTEGKLFRDGAQPMIDMDVSRMAPPPGTPFRAINVLLPVLVVLLSGFLGLLYIGGAFTGRSAYEALKSASFHSSRVFLSAALAGSAVAIALTVTQRLLSLTDCLRTWFAGARAMFFAVGILIFAWAMSALAQDLGTAYYLIGMLQGNLRPEWLPLLTFLMSAAVSFSTGTSWGTMGILLPTVGPLAYALGGMTTLTLSVGAVLDGSIFGDHCSPLSDTTLFSSAASGCDHIDHVKTQVPYALSVMMVASLCGYLAVSFGMPLPFSLVLATLLFAAIFLWLGRPLSDYQTTTGHAP